MKEIYLNYLTQKKDAKKLSYDDLVEATNISKSKLQRIFTGQIEVTVSDLETIVEKGFGESTDELYAKMGRQEFRDSAGVDYKGAQELLAEFAAEKEAIKQEYTERYTNVTTYLKELVKRSEDYNRELTTKSTRAEEIASAAQKRAEIAEKDRAELDKRRHQVFWCMLGLNVLLIALLVLGVVLDLPNLGLGNG